MTLRFVRQTAVAITLAACLAGCGSTGSSFGSSDSGSLGTRPADMYTDAEIRSKRLACTSSTVRDADRHRDAASRFCPREGKGWRRHATARAGRICRKARFFALLFQ